MKTLLLTIPFYLLTATALNAQGLYTQLSGGLMLNNGIRSDDTRNLTGLYGNATGELSVLADKKKWQAGAAIAAFNIKNKTQFLFEQDMVPDSLAREYDLSAAAPAIAPYIYANYKIPVGKNRAYLFAGARLGYYFATRQKEQHYPLYGMLNKHWQVVLHSRPCPVYGLQGGVATNGEKRLSAGANLAWQTINTRGTLNYTAVYTLYDMYGVPRRYTTYISKEIAYNLQLFSIQVFLRVRLNKTEKAEEETSETEIE